MERDEIYSVPPGTPDPGRPRSRFVRRRDRFAGLLLLVALLVGLGVQVYPRAREFWQQYQHHRLLEAIDRGDAQLVGSLVGANPWLLERPQPAGLPLLARAILAGHDAVAAQLREAGATPVLIVDVVDAQTRQRLPGSDIRMRLDGQNSEMYFGETAPYVLELPAEPARHISVRASLAGYVSTSWASRAVGGRGFGRTMPKIPDRIVLPLEPAHTIGGLVHNEQGQPVAGATLSLWLRTSLSDADTGLSQYVRDLVTTDSQGQWTSHGWPARIAEAPEIRLSHPDYVDMILSSQDVPSVETLQAHEAVLIARQGLKLIGVVVDQQRQPVADATVIHGNAWQSQRNVTTDADGRFVLSGMTERAEILTIRAKGFAPRVMELAVSQAGEPVEIVLQRGRHLTGRVQDPVGLPIGGAVVRLVAWPGQQQLSWQTHTDVLGTFSWVDAPHEPMTLQVAAEGYMSVRPRIDGSQDDPVVVTLAPIMQIKATIMDAATRLPVRGCEVMWAHVDEQGEVRWQSRTRQRLEEGIYQHRLVSWQPGYQLRVSAKGYHTAKSPVLRPGQRQVDWELALEPMEPAWRGEIRLPDGQPAQGALVYALGAAPQVAVIREDGLTGRGVPSPQRTTGHGAVMLYGDSIGRIVVLHEQGFAYHHFDAEPEVAALTLNPWAQLEGRAVRHGQPLADQSLVLDVFCEPNRRGRFRMQVQTDLDGRFVVHQLPAGDVEIMHSDRVDGRAFTQRSHRLSIQPGQQARVEFGGQGVAVTGRVDLEQVPVDAVGVRLLLRPRHDADHLTVVVGEDGRFHFDAVVPGRYDLYLWADVLDDQGRITTLRSNRQTITIADDGQQAVELATLVMPIAAR